jgi:hypothetical protein
MTCEHQDDNHGYCVSCGDMMPGRIPREPRYAWFEGSLDKDLI